MKKGHFSGKLNLLKFRNACIVSIKGKTAIKSGVFIPIDDNNLYVSADEELRPKGAYVDFLAWENDEPGRYGDTHSIRQSVPKEAREMMTEEERRAVPYIGNMRPYEQPNMSDTAYAPYAQTDGMDDLPF